MTSLNINEEQMQSVIAAAIVQELTPEKRKEIIQEAVGSLLKSRESHYGTKYTTPIHDAFKRAAQQVALKIATEELIGSAEFKKEVDSLLNDAIDKAFGKDREAIINRMVLGMFQQV